MTAPAYVTRETVLNVGGFGATMATKIDRAIFNQSRAIDNQLHRHFYPLTAAVTYHSIYRSSSDVDGTGFWLERDLQSVTSVTVDGVAETSYTLLPKSGDAYNRIIVDGFYGVDTIITGVWGYGYGSESAGTITADIATTTAATCACSDSSVVGVGDLITIGTEKMVVTGKTAADTTANLDGALTADASETTVTVDDGTQVNTGEEILVGSERMLVSDVTGNDLTVQRAHRGTTLAGHDTATDVYAYRTLTIARAAAGSTAATHTSADTISRNVPPPVIRDWCLAEVLNQIAQEAASYARVVGSGDNQREARGAGLNDARRGGQRYRRVRMAAV